MSNDAVVLVMGQFEAEISGTLTFTLNFRTSPPNDLKSELPCAVFRNINESELIRNVHGTKFRDKCDIWIHVQSYTKKQVTEIRDAFKTAHRAIWQTPGDGITHILWRNVTNNDQEDAKPQIFERIIKLEVQWDE